MAVRALHFPLTNLLLPKLRETAVAAGSPPSRVITVSSSLHRNACRSIVVGGSTGPRQGGGSGREPSYEPGIDLLDLQCQRKKYAMFKQYSQSKLADIMFSMELGRQERCRPDGISRSRSVIRRCQIGAQSTPPSEKKKNKKLRLLSPLAIADEDSRPPEEARGLDWSLSNGG